MTDINFDKKILSDFNAASEKEWLTANGLGGYAASSACGANTRKYHGLLVAAFNPPVDRYLLLSKTEEELSNEQEEYFLSCNLYSNAVIQPRGHLYLQRFELTPDPLYTYSINGDIVLSKKIFTVYGHNTTVIKYKLESAPGAYMLKLYPLVTFRDFHSNTASAAPGFTYSINHLNRHLKIAFADNKIGAHNLYLTSDRAVFKRNEVWNRGFILAREKERGEEFNEDLLCPGRFSLRLNPGESVFLIASVEEGADSVSAARLEKNNEKRIFEINNKLSGFYEKTPAGEDKVVVNYPCARVSGDLFKTLFHTADSFIVSRRSTGKKTVIAGYHWFSDWGRDTMISLCGLTLVTKKIEVCRDILNSFTENIKNGILPNRFSDDSSAPPEYNTADASLWYFYALHKYYIYTGDLYFIRDSIGAMKEIIDNYIAGTDFNIKMDAADSLITQGGPDVQLTWMDAKVDGFVVTPRSGKAVEINALWYNALCVYRYFAGLLSAAEISGAASGEGGEVFNEDAFDCGNYDYLIENIKKCFETKFKNVADGGLYDLIDSTCGGADVKGSISAQIRPNQIFAVSLPFSPLGAKAARSVVDTVENHLLTERGLRSLAAQDPEYKSRYEGGRFERDCAYHQGTVWAYLIGPFISAKLRVNNYDAETLDFCASIIQNFTPHLKEAGLMSISEIFDGGDMRRPAGCVSQAWSVAELLRVIYEDIEGNYRLPAIG